MAITSREDWPGWLSSLANFDPISGFRSLTHSFTPSTILFVISPFAAYYYSRKPIYVRWSPLLWAKLSAATCLVILRAVEGIFSSETSLLHTAMPTVAALLIGSIAFMEHRHSARPSTFLALLLIADLLDGLERKDLSSFNLGLSLKSGLAGASIASKLAIIALQDMPKVELIIDDDLRRTMRNSASGGFLGGLLSDLLSPLFRACYRPDLFKTTPEQFDLELHPKFLLRQLEKYWDLQNTSNPPRSGDLLIACLKAWKGTLSSLFLTRLALIALRYAHPFALFYIIQAIERQYDHEHGTFELSIAVTAALAVFISTTLVQSHFGRLMVGYTGRLRGGLVALQLEKLHRLTEADAKDAAPVALISSDVDNIIIAIQKFLMIPISILEVGIGSSLLSWFIGASAALVCLPILLSAFAGYFISRGMVKHLSKWTEFTNTRVSSTSRNLRQLTAIKMLGLGPTVSNSLQRLRITEVKSSMPYYRLEALISIFAILSDLGVPATTIGTALSSGYFSNGIASAKVFPLLSIAIPIQHAFPNILNSFSTMMTLTPCFARIQKFLCLPEGRDNRIDPPLPQSIHLGPGSADIIRFSHAHISPDRLKRPVLRGANFRLARGSITGVVGPPGAGKSTLLRTILGECEVVAGSVQVDGNDIGYCGEQVWLQDATIRENIVGVLPFNRERYDAVIAGCFLEEDLQRLPGGDEYSVGMHGSNLSGGQRQRIGIARAAYAQLDITLFDDVFRSLDIQTAICILHQLCGRNSMLRRAGCTIIVVTSLPQCMEVVDQLVFLDGLGHATLDTTYRNGPHQQQVRAALSTLNIGNNALLFLEKKELRALYRYLRANSLPIRSRTATEGVISDWQLVMFALTPVGQISAILHAMLAFMLSAAELLPDIFLRFWMESWPDDLSLYPAYASISLATSIIAFTVYYTAHTLLSPRISIGLHSILVRTISQSTLSFFGVADSDSLSRLFGEDCFRISRVLPKHMVRITYAGFASLLMIGLILSGNSYSVLALPGILTFAWCILRSYCASWRDTQRLDVEKRASLSAFFEETAAGLTHINSFYQHTRSKETATNTLTASQASFYMVSMMAVRLRFYMDALGAVVATIILLPSLFVQGSSTEASVGLAYHVVISLPRILSAAVIAVAGFDTTIDAVRRVFDFERQTPLENNPPLELPEEWPRNGAIELHNVFAYYTPNVNAAPALVDISLSIGQGQHVGIAGRSFSGKSSLLLAMLGFIRYEGRIEIDDIDISSIPPETLRSRLITIPQEPVVFDGTVRTNLLPFTMNNTYKEKGRRSAEDEQKDFELEQLLKRLHIWIPLIQKGGLNANIDDVGYTKGESQLLCIARAILRHRETGRKVILIDDATSRLNMEKERIANDVMQDCFRGCTVLRISARQSGLEGASSVAHLHRGEVVDPNQIDDDTDSEEDDDS